MSAQHAASTAGGIGNERMKVALNGVLNASVLDGWWPRHGRLMWGLPIGRGEEFDDAEYGDNVEAQALYQLLEARSFQCSTNAVATTSPAMGFDDEAVDGGVRFPISTPCA